MKSGISINEVFATQQMIFKDKLDIRTTTVGINLLPYIGGNKQTCLDAIRTKISAVGKSLVRKAEVVENRFGIPIVNKRLTITPIHLVLASMLSGDKNRDLKLVRELASCLDQAAQDSDIDFIGGFGAHVEYGLGYADKVVIESLPEVLNQTKRLCAFVNVGSTRAGINMQAVVKLGSIIHEMSIGKNGSLACAKLVVFCNAVSDNPFMAGGYHGTDHSDLVLHVGISGPGAVRRVVSSLADDADMQSVAEVIQRVAFQITRAGALIGEELARELKMPLGSIDLSLAPTTEVGDSVGEILEIMGLEKVGTHGTTAALAMLTDAVKKGGMMASTKVGGLSGAFIPVSEDQFLAQAVKKGYLSIEKLEAMTSVCSVGLDMVVIPGDTPSTVISGIIADESAIGMVNHKTTAVRLIPAQGKKIGETLFFGGLLGEAPVMSTAPGDCRNFVWRKGTIPAPVTSMRN